MRGTTTLILLGGLFACSHAQAPTGTSVCDHYSNSAQASNATAAQEAWIQEFVANVFGGNSTVFSQTSVQGILTPATFNGSTIHLLKYFDGSLYSTNSQSGSAGAVNWLDDGGIVALQSGQYANSNISNQHKVFSHFGSLFARVMGCSTIGSVNFTSALQKTSLYEIHKYMALDPFELGYFIEQVGLAGQLVGLTADEAEGIQNKMDQSLTYRCRANSALFPGGIVGPQSICTDKSCPLAPNSNCSDYDFDNGTSPAPALVNEAASPSSSSSSVAPSKTSSPSGSASPKPVAASSSHKTTDIAVGVAVPVGVLLLALLAFLIIRSRRRVAALENRLTRVEGGEPAYGIGNDGATKHYSQPAMASMSSPSSQRRAPSESSAMHSPDLGQNAVRPGYMDDYGRQASPHDAQLGGFRGRYEHNAQEMA